ncbi:MAG TPA: MFS transporter [Candidatus Corynebacterium faecigallinarum]|uniref:MFS transporter n=1 Tax=Candidatus Corynebacterium faecigallinarum TaxID=2838528 RepID=A0A9D2QG36_9CORY|nr:MFS transporter [Candidatus Corynebacterium faecigallinarum]
MFTVSFGANLFAPLLPVMRETHALGSAPVNFVLAIYVLGLIPALMIGGPMSDRRGRRAVVRPALLFSALGTLVTLSAHLGIGSAAGPVLLCMGRMLTGVAVGLVLAAGAAWLKEVSMETSVGTAARRATVATSAGFGVGPLVSGPVAEWLPGPDTTALIIHLVMVLLLTPLVWATPEAGRPGGAASGATADTAPTRRPLFPRSALSPRFLWSVAAWAPWAFGVATTSFAVLTPLVTDGMSYPVAFTGLVAGITMLTGAFVQPWAGRLRMTGRIHPAVYGLGMATIGMILGVVIAESASPVVLIPTAMVLGTAYGIMMVSGLREVQRIAEEEAPHELGALTAVFYAATYLGFFIPFVIALIAPVVGYPAVFITGAVITVVSMWPVVRVTRAARGNSGKSY